MRIMQIIDSNQEIVLYINLQLTTQPSESLQAKMIPKLYSFSKSIAPRLVFSVMQWNEPYTYNTKLSRMIIKEIPLELSSYMKTSKMQKGCDIFYCILYDMIDFYCSVSWRFHCNDDAKV